MSISRFVATAVVGVALLHVRDGEAHGGIPRAYQILFEPGNADHIVLRSDLWGLFDSRDGGKTWQYICAEAWDGTSSQLQNRNVALMPGGRILVASLFDGLRASDDLCTWRSVPGFDTDLVSIIVSGPASGSAVAVTAGGSGGLINGQLWSSADRGDTWQRLGSKLPPDLSPTSLAFAPSDPNIVYLAGSVIDSPDARLLRSSDAGMTWTSVTLPVSQPGFWDPRISAIDTERPNVVVLRIDGVEGYGEDIPDEVWGTPDGGATWSRLYMGTGDIPGIAIDPTTDTLFIAGPLEGVQAAPLDDALSNGQGAFQKVFDGMMFGLRATDQGLLVGGNNYTLAGVPAFTLGVSVDQGKTITGTMTMCDVQEAMCPSTSVVGDRCHTVWAGDDFSAGFRAEYIAPRCVADAGTSGTSGVKGIPQPGTSSDCGCHLGGTSTASPFVAIGTAFIALVLWRRKYRSTGAGSRRFQARREPHALRLRRIEQSSCVADLDTSVGSNCNAAEAPRPS